MSSEPDVLAANVPTLRMMRHGGREGQSTLDLLPGFICLASDFRAGSCARDRQEGAYNVTALRANYALDWMAIEEYDSLKEVRRPTYTEHRRTRVRRTDTLAVA